MGKIHLEIVRSGQAGGGSALLSLDISSDATVSELKEMIYTNRKKDSKFQPCRQRLLTDAKEVLKDDRAKLSSLDIKDGDQLFYKDLGPQMKFVTVYIYEYAGPLMIYVLLTLFRSVIHGPCKPLTTTQYVALFLWVFHFVKRILETLYVHEFGGMTMPVRNIFKNCAYYWGAGLINGYVLNKSWDSEPAPWHMTVGVAGFLFFMACNLRCHLILRALREPGSQEIKIPRGFLFELVSFPNYFCELTMWFFFSILVGFKWSAILYNLCGIYQMVIWAKERHQKYLDQFPNYPKNRKRLFPFIW